MRLSLDLSATPGTGKHPASPSQPKQPAAPASSAPTRSSCRAACMTLQSSKARNSLSCSAWQVIWSGSKEYWLWETVAWHRPSRAQGLTTKSWTDFTSWSCLVCTIGLCRVFIIWRSSKGFANETTSLSVSNNLADWFLACILDHFLVFCIDRIFRTVCAFLAFNVPPFVQGKQTSIGRGGWDWTWPDSRRDGCGIAWESDYSGSLSWSQTWKIGWIWREPKFCGRDACWRIPWRWSIRHCWELYLAVDWGDDTQGK